MADEKLEKFSLYNLLEDVDEAKDHAAEQPERVRAMARVMADLHRGINGGR